MPIASGYKSENISLKRMLFLRSGVTSMNGWYLISAAAMLIPIAAVIAPHKKPKMESTALK